VELADDQLDIVKSLQPYGSAIRIVERASLPLQQRVRERVQSTLGTSESGNAWIKRGLLGFLVASILWVAFGSMTFSPICTTQVSAANMREFAAPYEAKLEAVHVRAGDRVVAGQVTAGGMYFESMVFIAGIFVWAFAQNPFVSSCAYQLVVMASLVTLLFNANPLMQFDGYFILSELTGIQNLRSRARLHQKRMFMVLILGIPQDGPHPSIARRLLLTVYGCCAGLYRTTIVFSIAITVAMRFPLVGMLLAAFHLVTSIFGSLWTFGKWLLSADETAPVRTRARVVAVTAFAGLPLMLFTVPMPLGVTVEGLVGATQETYLNAGHAGVLEKIHKSPGQTVRAGQPLLTMSDVPLQQNYIQVSGQLQEAQISCRVV